MKYIVKVNDSYAIDMSITIATINKEEYATRMSYEDALKVKKFFTKDNNKIEIKEIKK